MTEIGATIIAIKAAYDLSNTFIDDVGGKVPREKIIELQRLLSSAKESATAALLNMTVLKDEAATRQRWEKEKSDYALNEISPGVFAYCAVARKPDQPNPFFCADCFNLERIAILQFQSRTKSGFKHFNCHTCGATVEIQV